MKYKIISCPFETKEDLFNIIMSLQTAEKFNLSDESNTTIQFGSKSLKVSVSISSEPNLTDEVLWLSKTALEELLIPENIEISVQIIGQGDIIKFGPIIGILTEETIIKNHKKGRPIREAFNCYAEAGNKICGLIYIFSINKIDLENKRIMGYVPQSNKSKIIEWKEQWVPIPDAIHNRLKISPSSSSYKKIGEMTKLFPAIKVINRTTSISKWRIQKIIEKDPSIKKYIPKTLLFKGKNTLTKMLQEFPSIYLKPIGRSLGLGVIKIVKIGPNEYNGKYRSGGKLFSLNGTLAAILPKLRTLMGKRIYIVQEGIPLATYNGNIFDLRVSVQKDETGIWSLSRWKVRVGAPNSIVTNISAGGKGAHINQVMNSVFKEDAPKIMDDIKTSCLTICSSIGNKISGIGDIGLDIGITEAGKIYFIEANFRELRLNGKSAEDLENWKSTFKKPIFYLNYLYNLQFKSYC